MSFSIEETSFRPLACKAKAHETYDFGITNGFTFDLNGITISFHSYHCLFYWVTEPFWQCFLELLQLSLP